MKKSPFRNRWRIKGRLTTETELHIGDGREMWIGTREPDADGKEESDASTVATDVRGAAFIPGSALKGVLRQRVCNSAGAWIDPVWDELFGSPDPDDEKAVGGKLEFQDAFHAFGEGNNGHAWEKGSFDDNDRTRPWWNPTRHTAVAVSVSLDRRTKTARDNLLYHLEYVPPGETFGFEITGDDLGEADVEKLLGLLEEFNGSSPQRVTLGALASNGWGKVTCDIDEVKCLDSLDHWKTEVLAGKDPFKSLPNRRDDAAVAPERPPCAVDELVIDVTLHLESPWLIRDPRQGERSRNGAGLPEEQKPRDAVAIHDEAGRPFAPAKSVRGVLRSRAEMILRTLGLLRKRHPADIGPVSTKAGGRKSVLKEIASLDPASLLFGMSGWRAPLEVGRFSETNSEALHPFNQEFVAIDRFTGGAADKLKFNASLAGKTTLGGKLRIDLHRLREVDRDDDGSSASLGLLALVLRDLSEGDLFLGSGSARGQGACSATITINDHDDWRKCEVLVSGLAALRRRAATVAVLASEGKP